MNRRKDSGPGSESSAAVWTNTSGAIHLSNDHLDAVKALLQPIHNRPEGDMVRALCKSLAPHFSRAQSDTKRGLSTTFSILLTRRAVSRGRTWCTPEIRSDAPYPFY
jgi:hypothetical protein